MQKTLFRGNTIVRNILMPDLSTFIIDKYYICTLYEFKMNFEMKYIALFFTLCIVGLYSCSDDVDSKVNGQWQLRSIDDNGVVTSVDTVFYSFQRGSLFSYTLLSHSDTDNASVSYGYVNFPSENEMVIAMDVTENEYGDHKNIIKDFLLLADWEDYTKTFAVISIDSKKMVLSSGQKTYSFKKY